MTVSTADVVICGAGISGIASAYHLAVTCGIRNVVLVDERPPLTLTSDKSTECYRNWWPGPGNAMVRLMNRSIDWLERWAGESNNRFLLSRRGYAYFTADPNRIADFKHAAEEAASLGAGAVRYHTDRSNDAAYAPTRTLAWPSGQAAPRSGASVEPDDYAGQPIGSDLVLDRSLILERFPYINENVVALVHPRRCGWFSGQQLGMYLLEQARAHGARLMSGRIDRIDVIDGRVHTIHVGADSIQTRTFVNAAGPYLNHVAHLIGVDLPVFNEFHGKIAFKDHLGIVPRDAPLLIWTDPQYLPWSDEERQALAESDETRWLLDKFPGGAHMRPEGREGSHILLMLWTYDTKPREPIWPPKLDPYYPDVLLRGMATMIPGLSAYFDKAPKPVYDGGYYCKTRENRPLVGPLPIEGAYVCGAVSGYGLMASAGVGELLALHVGGNPLPDYASAFTLGRYDDPGYQQLLENWGASGQL